jgi:adenine/guanine phosphoribosyltransferase-like PRPP-binding protein
MGTATAKGYKPQYDHAEYLRNFIRPENLKKHIAYAVKALDGYKFDAIAFRGMSGALIAPPVALELGKTLIMVRKGSETCHSKKIVEGDKAATRYIIVDDFCASGETAMTIQHTIYEKFAPQAKCLGVLEVDYITNKKLKLTAGKKYKLCTEHNVTREWLKKIKEEKNDKQRKETAE